eukprot:9832906-Ditylum_brightwellii.AAC.1
MKQGYENNEDGKKSKSGDGGSVAVDVTTTSTYIPGTCCPRCMKYATGKCDSASASIVAATTDAVVA